MRKALKLGAEVVATLAAISTLATSACSDQGSDCEANKDCIEPPVGGTAGAGMGGVGTGATGGNAGSGGMSGGSGGSGGTGGAAGSGGAPEPCDGACGGATPVCEETSDECVECTASEHCPAAASVCKTSTNTCVECTGHDDCEVGAPFCDMNLNTCVACLMNSACTDATASRCDMGTCAPCAANADCEHIAGKGVCGDGECVQCTQTDAAACGGNPCNPVTNTCSAFGTNRRPCESCDTDANCALADHLCVPMQYMGADRPGGYCLKSSAGGCERPFSIAVSDRTTLSGVAGSAFCAINETLTTCEAVRALLDDQLCPNGTDAECPQGSLCRTVGALSNRCTYPCGLASHCPLSAPANTCGGQSPTYCGG